ncbi:ATP-dependent DNA ligase Cdc17 [Coemansia interrupta]|uniref:DNA ligase 1 n=1 Tax=Coemansia interrupta TaxID=1126814 RepID=A0A9W8LNY1_9FUNG|nr:ATP-dependent DNA ligase Cdc17 [Coemansia interrupta]
MKQPLIASFFGKGGMAKAKPSKPTDSETPANGSPSKSSGDDDTKTTDNMDVDKQTDEVKEESELEVRKLDVKASKLDIKSNKSNDKPALGSKRRIVDSDDDGSATELSDKEDTGSATDLSDSEEEAVPAAAAAAASKKKKRSAKPAPKKAKGASVKVKKAEPIKLIDTKEGKKVPFLALCKVFEAIEATPKRLEITALIRDFFVQVMDIDKEELTDAVMLCIAKVAPDHEGIELGIGESILLKSIASATGRQIQKVKQEHQALGDLGVVVERGKSNQNTMFKPKPLSISKVFHTFREIATTSGSSSIQKKTGLITGLLGACTNVESKYLIRSLEGRLRIGLAESTVQTALAHAALIRENDGDSDSLDPEDFVQATENLKQVLSEFPVYTHVIDSIYKYGINDVANHCTLTPTLPVKPMLAKIEKAADDILRRFEGKPFTCEFKYDGERSQIHYVADGDDTKCVIFSRNAENNTAKYPDITSSNKFQFAISKDLIEVEDIQEFLELSIEENCEGLMIKTLDGSTSSYEPSKRSMNWLKLKKDYVDGLGDSLDLVVIGAYFGKGKRVGAYGAYLLACYDPDREEYQAICKIGTGFSDADLESHKAKLDESRISAPKPYYAFSEKTKPDIWFAPTVVWEVKAADLSLSPIYQAAYGEIDPSKGVSLRFPRFIRIRDDKSPEMATSSTQVAEMYESQKINH